MLSYEVENAVKTVTEYLSLTDNSMELKTRNFGMPYKLLAEFNGVVLGGVEHSLTGCNVR